ncbi:MAG: transcriptional regulator with XRE-family HTH domain [Myxococcota bacterium]|jgi:transcriptional regulator with XRE-family HTH domain
MVTEELDYEQIARELLISLRGKRSQTAWSRRLGYRSNVAYAWESGRRWPTAAELMRAAGRSGLDVAAALTRFYGHEPPWLEELAVDSPEAVARLLDDLRGNTPINDLAAASGISRYSISRWLSGHTQPRLPDFLRLVETASVRLIDLLAVLASPSSMPTVDPIWKRLEARRQGADKLPWTQAILRALELADYLALPAHEPGWIARRLGISDEEEARCLSFLRDTGQVHWQGVRYRIQKLAVDTNRNPTVNRRLKAHWSRVGAERVEQGAPGQFSYNVFSVSRADFERIREAHLRYFYALRAIVAESEPDEVVAVANVQLFMLGDEPSG